MGSPVVPRQTLLAQCQLRDSKVSDEELPRRVSNRERKCTSEKRSFLGSLSVKRALMLVHKSLTRYFCVS